MKLVSYLRPRQPIACYLKDARNVTFSLSDYYIKRNGINIFVVLDDYCTFAIGSNNILTYGTEIQQQ